MEKQLSKFIKENGLSASCIDFEAMLGDVLSQMEDGLSGNVRSVEMIPTFLIPGKKFPSSCSAVAIDCGGTNMRTARVIFDEAGHCIIEDFKKQPMPGTQGEIDIEDYFKILAERISQFDEKNVGLSFSFATIITPERDGRIIELSKQVFIKNSEGVLLAEGINRALKAMGRAERNITVINDTCAVMLGGSEKSGVPEDTLGMVLGTGFNICYFERNGVKKAGRPEGMIINTELGRYTGYKGGPIDKELGKTLQEPEKPLLEKFIAGAFLGKIVSWSVRKAAQEGLFSEKAGAEFLKMEDFQIKDCLDENGPLFALCKTEEERKTIKILSSGIIERSAKITAVMLTAALIKTGRGKTIDNPVYIAAEGTSFYAIEQIYNSVQKYLSEYAEKGHGIHWALTDARDTTLIGTAAAACGNQEA